MNQLLIILGKFFSFISRILNIGNGSTWPGHLALKANSNFVEDILNESKTKLIIVAGTNGKTTTGRMITSIIRENGKTFLQNKAGANLLNGLASTLISGSGLNGKLNKDYLIFESDENALPLILEKTQPDYIIALNLFRDQLDRYGEIDSIAKRWKDSFIKLTDKTKLILNADDPLISTLLKKTKAKVFYFGLNAKNKNKTTHGADSTYCTNCGNKLHYSSVFFSHLGNWYCTNCHAKRPNPDISRIEIIPLPGQYNYYNALSAALFSEIEGINKEKVKNAFKSFTPAFGRQEKITYRRKTVKLFLSKNPISFNESLQTIKDLGGKNILILLNDRIPDGLDVSWIWDINFEEILTNNFNIGVSGDRIYDMSLRLKYASFYTHFEKNQKELLDKMVNNLEQGETLYILPNYSAMLEIRKILLGRSIL